MASPAGSEGRGGEPRRPQLSDEAVELALGRLLQAGVLVAAALTLSGGIVYLLRYGRSPTHYGTFTGEPEDLSSLEGIVHAALAGRGRGLIQLGLLVLIATPVMRVAVSLLAFILQRDKLYVLLTGFVLLLLVTSLVGL